jgi:raffinose/stachyose/melibiose transport system permease protein
MSHLTRIAGAGRLARVGLLFLPSLILIGAFTYYPAVRSLIGGFTEWDGFNPPRFVGLQEFREYLTSLAFGAEVRNVFLLMGGTIVISIIAQFTAAEIVSRLRGRVHATLKYLLALPIVIPLIVQIDIWAYMFTPNGGVIDSALHDIGLPSVDWLGNPHTALLSILLIGFPWIGNLGFLVFLGGLQRLPGEVREAAQLDGAGSFRRVVSIDIPLLVPQFRVVTILSAIYAVQNFIPILILTNGGPGNATEVPALDMYDSAFQGDQYGYGMAIGALLFLLLLAIALVASRLLRPRT